MRVNFAPTLAAAGLWLPGLPAAAAPAPLSPAAFVTQACSDCHAGGVTKGDFSLEKLDVARPGANPEAWELVVRKLRHRLMPPADEWRPDEPSYEAMIAHLETQLDEAARAAPNPGRGGTFRRLTRREYHQAIRDLLDLEVDVAALLPKDDISLGFDNITVGGLSATLMDRYLAAARKIGMLAIGRPPALPVTEVIRIPPDLTQESHFEGMPFGTRGGAAAAHVFPVDGEYEFQLRLTRDRNGRIEGRAGTYLLDLLLDGATLKRLEYTKAHDRGASDDGDQVLNARAKVRAGTRTIGAAFVQGGGAMPETEKQPNLAQFHLERHPRPRPALATITVVGPFQPAGAADSPSRRRIFGDAQPGSGDETATARRAIENLAHRAFRRTVTPEDLAGPWRLYEETRRTEGFDAGIEAALRAVLASPHFIFRIERDPPAVAGAAFHPVSDFELASRLSFFLWGAIPDDRLLAAASRGDLGRPSVFDAEVRRLLDDERSSSLARNFAAQWLHLVNLDTVAPDSRLFLEFDHNLRRSMRRETELLFADVLRSGASVLDLLRSSHTFLDERLARHYRIPGVHGARFRRVELPPGSHRRGLLTHASILTVTSFNNRTSPVVRGNWIVQNILGAPLRPPPPNVGELQERTPDGRPRSIKDQVAEHRKAPACAGCHALLDPPGFALEHFDAIGQWRNHDGEHPIESAGALPDGSKFEDAVSLQEAILRRPELFAQTALEKLLVYALGRGLTAHDMPEVRRILRATRPGDYRLRDLVVEVTRSLPFQHRSRP